MHIEMDETQRAVVDAAEKLIAAKYGDDVRRHTLEDAARVAPGLWAGLAELGLMGLGISEEYGGAGGTFADVAGLLELFGRTLVVEPFAASTVVAAYALGEAGSAAQKAEILPGVAEGRTRLAFAHNEPDTRHSVDDIALSATKRGDGWRLEGRKTVVAGAPLADWLIVSARTSGKPGDRAGLSLFLVPAKAAGMRLRAYPLLGGGAAGDVFFEGVDLSASALLGAEGGAYDLVSRTIDRAIVAQCCTAMGAMAKLQEITLDYIKSRKQFGQPIGKFQALQHRMVDMTMAMHLARPMVNLAVSRADEADEAQRAPAVAAAKARVILSAQEVGRGAIQLHGGIGMTMEYDAGRYFRLLTEIEHVYGDLDTQVERYALSA